VTCNACDDNRGLIKGEAREDSAKIAKKRQRSVPLPHDITAVKRVEAAMPVAFEADGRRRRRRRRRSSSSNSSSSSAEHEMLLAMMMRVQATPSKKKP
jgi:hypothetical protein